MGGEPPRDPIDFSGFSTEKNLPAGDFRIKEKDEDVNCDVWGQVDFGLGLVSVRCTRVGLHVEHVCSVVITHK